jgi:3-methyladenine DNA glycosylase/8-oxoguanine DNA glycosylase
MNTYTEFVEKAQAEFLNGLKQAQDLNVKAIASVTELIESKNGEANLPTPAEIVEKSFAFTSQLLESRKEYMLKLAELLPKN